MAAVLTSAATIRCVHATTPGTGTVTLSASQQRLTAGGNPVLVGDDLKDRPVTGCPLVGPSTVPCAQTKVVLIGAAARMAVDGDAVLLDTANGTTDSTPPGTWKVIAPGQTTLQAD